MKMIVACAQRENVDGGNYLGIFCTKGQADSWKQEQLKDDKVSNVHLFQSILEEYAEE